MAVGVAHLDAGARPHAARHGWLHGPFLDVVLGWCFVPVAIVVHLVEPHRSALRGVLAAIFLLSFAHQPLTLGLVYGDPVQRRAHRRIYALTPVVAAGAIVLGLHVSLGTVALMAGLRNAEHTLMQRYGLLRIYGRKAGDQHGGMEKPMLVVWLVAALAYLAAFVDLDAMVGEMGLGRTNRRSVEFLQPLEGVATVVFWVAVAAGTVLAVRWLLAERRHATLTGGLSHAKHVYALGTLGLVVAVMVDPIAGIAGYVAAHAIEYFAVVHRSLRTRTDRAWIASVSRTRRRRSALYAAYFAAVATIVLATDGRWGGHVYAFAVLFFGAMHIFYDGFVWKLRRPNVAASLGLASGPPAAPAAT